MGTRGGDPGWRLRWARSALSIAIAFAAALVASPSSAAADVRYAAHDGTGAACTELAPCTLKTAIEPGAPGAAGSTGDIQDGDTVILLSEGTDFGFGAIPNMRLVIDDSITLRGEPGQPRPTIVTNATGFQPEPFLNVTAPGVTIEGLRIEAGGQQGRALNLDPAAAPSVVRDVYIEGVELNSSGHLVRVEGASTIERAELVRFNSSTLTNGETLLMVGNVLLRDSFVRHTGAQGAIRTWGPSTAARIRNVTVASGATAIFSNFQPQQVSIRNALIDGANDIAAASSGDVIDVTVSHSSYNPAQVSDTGAGATVTEVPPNQNQTAAGMFPLLADPLNGDFRQLAGSPTINAGSADAFTGAADIDGQSRVMGAAIDIGADEFFEQSAAPDSPAAPGGQAKKKKRCKKGFKLKKVKRKGKRPKKKCVKRKRKKKKR